jgi:hypothetical protein
LGRDVFVKLTVNIEREYALLARQGEVGAGARHVEIGGRQSVTWLAVRIHGIDHASVLIFSVVCLAADDDISRSTEWHGILLRVMAIAIVGAPQA